MIGFKPFLKYCVVGFLGTAIDVGSLYILVEFVRLPLLVATTASFLLAVTNNFLLNNFWTFKSKSKNYRKLYIKFFIVSCVGLLLTNLSMFLQVELIGIWYVYAKLITSGLVLSWNFLGNKYWTFSIKERTLVIPKEFPYFLTIVIPAYNEENRLGPTLLAINDYLQAKKLSAEIIVVDDGSTDGTSQIVETQKSTIKNLFLLTLPKNQGKGYAFKKGVEFARGENILLVDADNSTPIQEFDKLLAALNEHDIAIGSRYLKDSHIHIRQPFFRVLVGRFGNALIQIFLVDKIKDTQCGFKLFKHAVAKEIFSRQKVHRWGFDMEALAIAKMLDYQIVEVPVSWLNSSDTRLRPIRDTFRTFFELIYIKLNLLSGRYRD
jgi:dolichyl-phosphate beta-glucosyltransferase